MARAVLTLSSFASDVSVPELTLTVCVPIATIVTTMTPAMPPARVATIPAIRIIVAFRAVPLPISVVVLSSRVA
jgi:hypothetical protein